MSMLLTIVGIAFLSALGLGIGHRKATLLSTESAMHSTPRYHAGWVGLCTSLVPIAGLIVLSLWGLGRGSGLSRLAGGSWSTSFLWLVSVAAGWWALGKISPTFPAVLRVETLVKWILFCASAVAILTTFGIVLSLLSGALKFFQLVGPLDFLFGLEWSPQTALRADQVGSEGLFGFVPLFTGTLLISFIAMVISIPVGLLAAVFMVEYASPRARSICKPLLEILAGVPTVVYGYFAALTVAPAIRAWAEGWGLNAASESAMAAGLVMGVMIIPFISSLTDDMLAAVPRGLREASYGLGATRSETILRVLFPAAFPGIMAGILLALSRAIGETMIVVMAAGLTAKLTANPLESVTTVTVQIATLLIGDQEFDSAKTLSAFALGLALFVITLMFNLTALHVVRKYKEDYE